MAQSHIVLILSLAWSGFGVMETKEVGSNPPFADKGLWRRKWEATTARILLGSQWDRQRLLEGADLFSLLLLMFLVVSDTSPHLPEPALSHPAATGAMQGQGQPLPVCLWDASHGGVCHGVASGLYHSPTTINNPED